MSKATLILVDGTTLAVAPKNGKVFKLEELQGYVGGYIEINRVGDRFLVVNEDGKRDQQPNHAATEMYGRYLRPGDYFSGPVLSVDPDMLD
jgi:hypothetical protein